MSKRIPLPKALAVIVASALLTSGSFFIAMRALQKSAYKRRINPNNQIQFVVQKPLLDASLPTDYLAELLGLSLDRPLSYYNIDTKQAEKKLLLSPYIGKARVRREFPQSVIVEYETYAPLAILYDFENSLVDREGHLLPLYPFYLDKKLPEIYLGLKEYDETLYDEFWSAPLSSDDFELAKRFISRMQEQECRLRRVDLSNRKNLSLGKREITLILENVDKSRHFVRLPVKGWEKQLSNYLNLRKEVELLGEDRVIDLRLSSLAYILETSQNPNF